MKNSNYKISRPRKVYTQTPSCDDNKFIPLVGSSFLIHLWCLQSTVNRAWFGPVKKTTKSTTKNLLFIKRSL